jgi:transcriptional regulatory protein LEU3
MIYRTLTLAACTILRIYRSDLRLRTDLSLGERCYFAAIHILRKRSLQNNDVSSRSAAMLTQLWQSKQIFRRADGTGSSLRVRIRSRGVSFVPY